MNLDDMKLSDLMKLVALFNGQKPSSPHPFVGRYVICRCYAAGVHSGVLLSADGENVLLRDSRRLWSWKSAKPAVALSGVAQSGLAEGCKIDVVNPEIALTGVAEIIPCSTDAERSIREYK